jgi:hypothetical protein
MIFCIWWKKIPANLDQLFITNKKIKIIIPSDFMESKEDVTFLSYIDLLGKTNKKDVNKNDKNK